MKHKISIFLPLLLLLASCAKENLGNGKSGSGNAVPEVVFSAGFSDGTKTTLVDGRSVVWEPGEEISVFSGSSNAKFTSTNTATAALADFRGRIIRSQNTVYALYPYSADAVCKGDTLSFPLPQSQTACSGGFSRGQFPTVAKTSTDELNFKNVCGGIKLSVSRSDIREIVFESLDKSVSLYGTITVVLSGDGVPAYSRVENGGSSMTLSAPDSVFHSDESYYMVLPPVALTSGYSITYYTAGQYGTYVSHIPVSITRGKFARCLNLDDGIEFIDATDLSKDGTANCYVVPSSGLYKFKANVKGGSSEPLEGTPVSAEVLWESFGTDVTPSVGDVVESVRMNGNYVIFSTPSTLNNGNAVIAVKDDSNNILWSWHIWVCKDFDPVASAQVYNNNAGTMMDRNLGATSATPGDVHALGLLYEWGRKDPFLNSSSISNSVLAKATIEFPAYISPDSSTGTVKYSVQHPTTYIRYSSSNYHWLYSDDTSLWGEEKSEYDPCPPGWQIPYGGTNNIWAVACGSTSSFSYTWDTQNKGMDFSGKFEISGSIWYPAAGQACDEDGKVVNVGTCGRYWTTTTYDYPNRVSSLTIDNSDVNLDYRTTYDEHNSTLASAFSIRCMRMYTGGAGDLEDIEDDDWSAFDLSSEETANCYTVSSPGTYVFNGAVKGNSTESVGTPSSAEVLWESFGTDVAPNVGDVISSAKLRSDGYVKFITPATLNDGNAVIAVKDASGNILWSWHIWVCKGFDPDATAQVYNNGAGTMMDRNIGAISATPGAAGSCGLLYQWGRKDPFLGGSCCYDSAASTITWPSAENASDHLGNNNTLSYSISHPTAYLKNGNYPYDWYCTSDSYQKDDLWSSDKSIYDPCPAGWRVPDGGSSGVWSTAFGSSSDYSSVPWDNTNRGMNFGSGNGKSSSMQLGSASTIWYPAAGYRLNDTGTLYNVGNRGFYWSCTPSGYGAYRLGFNSNGYVYPSGSSYRAGGQSVRCLSESK